MQNIIDYISLKSTPMTIIYWITMLICGFVAYYEPAFFIVTLWIIISYINHHEVDRLKDEIHNLHEIAEENVWLRSEIKRLTHGN